ncbi:MAG: hypothetical protein IT353_06730 [Gemmatimonadaceae bacterium]|nr:hypothetical protein [Gemmatimonadaceae bacterium]
MHAVVRGLKKIRGAISLTVLWSVAWMVLGSILVVVFPSEHPLLSGRVTIGAMKYWGIWGAFAGLVYASCLALEQAHTFREISRRRGLLWGALSGMVVPLGLTLGSLVISDRGLGLYHVFLLLKFSLAGAVCGIGTLAIARRADTRDGSTTLPPNDQRMLPPARSWPATLVQRLRDVVKPWVSAAHALRALALGPDRGRSAMMFGG